MSWSFRTTEYVGCSLKAVVPARVVDANVVSGVAERAAEFLSLVAINPPASETAPIEIAPERLQAAALTAAPTVSRPVVMTLARIVRLPQIAPIAANNEEAAPVDTPKSFSLAAAGIAAIVYHPPANVLAAPLSSPAPILEIEAPTLFQSAAIINAPAPYRPLARSAVKLPALSPLLPPETPETLDAPATLRTPAAVTRIAARPLVNPVASLSDAHPITEIAAPAPLDRARLAPMPPPLAPPLSRTGLGAQITLAIPPYPANPPSSSAVPAAYTPNGAATFENAAVPAADEEELLGAP